MIALAGCGGDSDSAGSTTPASAGEEAFLSASQRVGVNGAMFLILDYCNDRRDGAEVSEQDRVVLERSNDGLIALAETDPETSFSAEEPRTMTEILQVAATRLANDRCYTAEAQRLRRAAAALP